MQYLLGTVNICGMFVSFRCGCFWSFASHDPLPSVLSLSLSLSFLVMRCGWAETRPHVSAGFAASSAPIISSFPWRHAQRQLTARHLTAASHAWTPDTVIARTKSAVSCWNIQFKVRSMFTNRLTGKLPGREVASSVNHCCLCATKSRGLWVTFLQRKSLNCTDRTGEMVYWQLSVQ